jgi:hypothetical protein
MTEPTTTNPVPAGIYAQHPQYGPVMPTNTMAILSLVFAFLFWPLSIVFGHQAKKQIKMTDEAGSGLATAGLVISYICLGFFLLMLLLIVIAGVASAAV